MGVPALRVCVSAGLAAGCDFLCEHVQLVLTLCCGVHSKQECAGGNTWWVGSPALIYRAMLAAGVWLGWCLYVASLGGLSGLQ